LHAPDLFTALCTNPAVAKKNTHHAREVSSSNEDEKLIKNGVISSNFLSKISSNILQRGVHTISSNKTNRYSKYTVLTRDV